MGGWFLSFVGGKHDYVSILLITKENNNYFLVVKLRNIYNVYNALLSSVNG